MFMIVIKILMAQCEQDMTVLIAFSMFTPTKHIWSNHSDASDMHIDTQTDGIAEIFFMIRVSENRKITNLLLSHLRTFLLIAQVNLE
jgi:hypothetical protein